MSVRLMVLALAGMALVGCTGSERYQELPAPQASAPAQPPTRVILFIGDGVGTAYWSAARFATQDLAIEQFPVVGLVDTRSASHKVTDSAAGATVYATGVRTYNRAIGVGPDSLPLKTVLEIAVEQGMATGLVATSTITHATPGSFAAHVADRRMEPEIARQMAAQKIDVLLGGGRHFFDGTAEGASNLLPELRRRFVYIDDAAALSRLALDTVPALLGLFAEGGMPTATEGRTPALPEMTRAALKVVDRNPNGFFLMVEASQPDWRGHANEPVDEVVAEMLDYDQAVRVALEYQDRHPETLIVLTADHETGGLAIQQNRQGEIVARYTTTGHTGSMIPLFARGPGAERFGGVKDNYQIGQLLLEAIKAAASQPPVSTSPMTAR
jgi:alkaline phosphatase